jgi:hypothetical protein
MTGCGHLTSDGPCPETKGVRQFIPGLRCPAHTPAVLAGNKDHVPDPEQSLAAYLRRAGHDPVKGLLTPAGPTVVDTKAILSGKRRSNTRDYRAARGDAK